MTEAEAARKRDNELIQVNDGDAEKEQWLYSVKEVRAAKKRDDKINGKTLSSSMYIRIPSTFVFRLSGLTDQFVWMVKYICVAHIASFDGRSFYMDEKWNILHLNKNYGSGA